MPRLRRVPDVGKKLIPGAKKGPRPAEWRKPTPGRYLDIRLTVRHTVNGTSYGPGPVRVRENLARALLNAEERVQAQEYAFLHPTDKILRIRYGAPPAVEVVPSGYFDSAVADMMERDREPSLMLRGTGA